MSEMIVEGYLQVVVFSLVDQETRKKEHYGIPIEQVREIRPMESITKVPNAKSYIKGVMNLRGMIIPIMDIRGKLGFNSGTPSPKTRILVADSESKLTGLLIDEVDQVMRIPLKEIETHLSGGLESLEYIKGVAKTSEKLIVLLDIAKLLGCDSCSNLEK